jgi:hypothetical protein
MLFRLVRPVLRKGSRVPDFVQRIPADVRAVIRNPLRLAVPVGGGFHRIIVRPGANDIRFSLRTTDPTEGKMRQLPLHLI